MSLTVKCTKSKEFKDGTVFIKGQFYESLPVWKESPHTGTEAFVAWEVFHGNNKPAKRLILSLFRLHFS